MIGKHIGRILKEKKLSGESKRCPKCKELSLTFDITEAKVYCTKCSYKEYLLQ